MYAYIEGLTSRMRLFPLGAMTSIKQSVNWATRPTLEDLLRDANSFTGRLSDPAVGPLVSRALEITNNLTYGDVELYLGRDLPLFYE